MATISCRCGTVKLQFPTRSPRASQECCCRDCHGRIAHLANLGGPSMPDVTIASADNRTRPATFYYFVNRITVLSGGDRIKFYLMKEGSTNHNMASSCCNTFLMGHSPAFSGNTVGVPKELGTLSGVDEPNDGPLLRWFPADMPGEVVDGPAGSMPSAWLLDDGKPTGTEGWEIGFGKMCNDVWGADVLEAEDVGDKFVDLLEEYKARGKEVEIVSK
mmetsp:Transcript_38315/g.83261  ORF Transcript_38315/g.83261 Transcript_38315/m.83261 type:complete len:217 (-) Transcript_38315:119-769(-)